MEWAIFFATLAGPILAVQAQKWIERATERHRAKNRIFGVLMATRATRIAADHVQALNMIDLEFGQSRFPSTKEREVLNRWRVYADHLGAGANPEDQGAVDRWVERSDVLFADLLEGLARAQGFKFDRVQLMRGIYYPKAHGDTERRQELFNQALLNIVTGQTALPMKVTEFPVSEDALVLQRQLHERVLASYSDDGSLRVKQVA